MSTPNEPTRIHDPYGLDGEETIPGIPETTLIWDDDLQEYV